MLGFLYGCILAFLSLGAAGAGHGTLIPLLLSSAPLSVCYWVADTDAGREAALFTMLFGAPFLWAALGSLVALAVRGKGITLALLLVVLLHDASGLAVVAATFGSLANVLADLRRTPELVAVWATVYLVGQATLSWQISKCRRLRPTASRPRAAAHTPAAAACVRSEE
jgi:hypothetical protein